MMLCLRILVLFTLCTILNAIVCCLQLNTGRGADANPKVDFLGIDACWMAVYVFCRNALSKSNSSHHDMYVHCYALSICQLPNCNLFTHHVSYLLWRDTTSELWTPVHFLILIKHLLQSSIPCYFLQLLLFSTPYV